MERSIIIKFIIFLILSLGQSFLININLPESKIRKNEISINHNIALNILEKYKDIIILKETKAKDSINFGISYIGTKEELLKMLDEFNSNKFIQGINNLKIEKINEKWNLSAFVEFSSYIEYTYNR
ncbi:hypothetical protein [Clostridium sp. 'White wine YQ']|uniref:hypothetical protein n=1 Tax=Clostridium sp. 'White wine YQ' TaxID=3027474 RepID=UPI0023662F7B|nr:hypothetical protein [Clostridium sp. 'White wine YQ']MDD7793949.1 hypothetical protein [Clostridium sp. 'White wine YQ']